jgi:hypothetical protein
VFSEIRKSDLVAHIRRQSQILGEYESLLDTARDPKEKERARMEIATVRHSLDNYVRELKEIGGDLPADITPSTIGKRPVTRILFLAASPSDRARLRSDQEMRQVDEKLRLASQRDAFELEVRAAVRPEDLSQALLDAKPSIVHFSGHGSSYGLFLEDHIGKSHPVSPTALGALFQLVANTVSCVVLSACFSEVQAREIVRHIRYVIGMSNEIGDAGSIAFAAGFYQALGAGKSVEDAFRFGVVQMQLKNIPGNQVPELLKKA